MNARVTVCMPCFNRGPLISEALDSIIAQTDPRWELLVVDDGSTDDSEAIVAKYARLDGRIRLIRRNRDPKGAGTCRNIAVASSGAEYVMFLDTDDLLVPHCIEQRLRVMDQGELLDFAIFPMYVFREKNAGPLRFWNVENGVEDLVRLLRMDPVCQGTGTLWRRESFERLGGWNETLAIWQDIELHIRAFTSGMRFVKRLDLEPDVMIRETEASLSRGSYDSRDKIESRARVAAAVPSHLRGAGRNDLLGQARFIFGAVILAAQRARLFDIARDLRRLAAAEGVISRFEDLGLLLAHIVRRSRLDRLALIRMARERATSSFISPSTIGTVAVG